MQRDRRVVQCTRMVVNTVHPCDNHPIRSISAKQTSRVFGASWFFCLLFAKTAAQPSDFSNHTQYGNYTYGLPQLVNFVCKLIISNRYTLVLNSLI